MAYLLGEDDYLFTAFVGHQNIGTNRIQYVSVLWLHHLKPETGRTSELTWGEQYGNTSFLADAVERNPSSLQET